MSQEVFRIFSTLCQSLATTVSYLARAKLFKSIHYVQEHPVSLLGSCVGRAEEVITTQSEHLRAQHLF